MGKDERDRQVPFVLDRSEPKRNLRKGRGFLFPRESKSLGERKKGKKKAHKNERDKQISESLSSLAEAINRREA